MKKLTSILLSAIIMLTAVVGFDLAAYAAGTSASDAQLISLNTEYSDTLQSGKLGKQFNFYQFVMPETGNAKIKLDLYDSVYKSFCNIYDSDGKEIYDLRGIYNRAFDCYKIDSEVALNKGIYYISISNYSIDGFNLNYGGTYYFSVNYMQKLTKPLNLKLSAQKGAKIKAKWDSVNGANGYQIYYSRNKNFKKLSAKKIVKGGKKTSYVGKNFTKGKKYYVKVRAYKNVNGQKVYGKWSNVKTVKCK